MRPGWTPPPELVADLRRTLAQAPDRHTAAGWRTTLDAAGPALLTRAAAPVHVTASGVVLTPDGRRTCLVLHGRIGRWVQPGGHLEPGDRSVAAAAAREVLEETGLRAEVDRAPLALHRHPAPCAPGVVEEHLDVQHLLVLAEEPPVPSAESRDVAWWPVDDLPEPLADGVAATVARAVTRVLARSAGQASTSPACAVSPVAADHPSR